MNNKLFYFIYFVLFYCLYLWKEEAQTLSVQNMVARFAVAFDIDGVLLRGNQALPWTLQALRRIEAVAPFIYLTNGGGMPETARAQQLQEIFRHPVSARQVILGHTPFRTLVPAFGHKPVLVIGRNSCKDAALQYGFQKPVLTHEYLALNRSRWPFSVPSQPPEFPIQEPISAVLAFHDSQDWGRDVQILIDTVREGSQNTESKQNRQQVPFYMASADLLFKNDFPAPRLAQGALSEVAKLLFKKVTGEDLEVTYFGKPQPIQYDFANRLLTELNNNVPPQRIYAIGDNPSSDIAGANNAGWTSILVRTGVYDNEYRGDTHNPTFICEHVGEAVDIILEHEKNLER